MTDKGDAGGGAWHQVPYQRIPVCIHTCSTLHDNGNNMWEKMADQSVRIQMLMWGINNDVEVVKMTSMLA